MKPHKSVKNYRGLGVKPADNFNDSVKASLLKLDGKNGEEYWMILNNFLCDYPLQSQSLIRHGVYQLSQAVSEKYHAQLNVSK